jgi:hypothetical protein
MSSSSPLTSALPHHVLQITLTLLSKLDIIVSQREHDSTLDSTWLPPSASPARAPGMATSTPVHCPSPSTQPTPCPLLSPTGPP